MDSFDVMISPKALEQLSRYVEYIHDTLLNPIAAERVWKDAMDTRDQLAAAAGSLPYCNHPELRQMGYRIIGFRHHKYVMLYRVNGKTAYVDGIYHQMQDYENTFAMEREY